jgi:hypothetical protein
MRPVQAPPGAPLCGVAEGPKSASILDTYKHLAQPSIHAGSGTVCMNPQWGVYGTKSTP